MKKLILLLVTCSTIHLIGDDTLHGGFISDNFGNRWPLITHNPPVEVVNLSSIDWKTNEVKALVWNYLSTNVATTLRSRTRLDGFEFRESGPYVFDKITTVNLVRKGSCDGVEFILSNKLVWRTNEVITVDEK